MIKGISDVRRLPRLGKIRLGEKKISQGGKEYPSKLDHFNFKDVPAVELIYGKNCKELEIVLPHEDRDVFFSQERKAYRKTGLFCKSSDGETATRVRVGVIDGKTLDPDGEEHLKESGEDCEPNEMFELPCLGEDCSFSTRKLCKPIGRLMFMLPKVPVFGCFEISTTSFNSMVTLNSYIEAIRAVAGRVSMILLTLRLVPKQVQVEGKATKIFHLELVYKGTIDSLLAYQKGLKALPAPIPKENLPTKEDLDQHVPDDLMRSGGQVLEDTLSGAQEAGGQDGASLIDEPEGNPADEARAAIQEPPAPAPAPAPRPAPAPAAPKPVEKAKPAPVAKKAIGTLF